MTSILSVVIKARSSIFLGHLNCTIAFRRPYARVRSLNSILLAYNLPLTYPPQRELKLALACANKPFDVAACNLDLSEEEMNTVLDLIADRTLPYFR